jgi:hypothetical protein
MRVEIDGLQSVSFTSQWPIRVASRCVVEFLDTVRVS